METMDYKSNRALDRDWQIVKEIDEFIVRNDRDGYILATRCEWWDNYFLHLARLVEVDQMIIQRDDQGKIIGICGWVLTDKAYEHEINKANWKLPEDISHGDILHITICVMDGGNIYEMRQELLNLYVTKFSEVCWYNAPKNKFVRHKNILKEICHV